MKTFKQFMDEKYLLRYDDGDFVEDKDKKDKKDKNEKDEKDVDEEDEDFNKPKQETDPLAML